MADFVAGKGELASSAVTAASATAGDMTGTSRAPVTEVIISMHTALAALRSGLCETLVRS